MENQKPLYGQIQEALQYIRTQTDFRPRYGIILGTGLSGLADKIKAVAEISYGDIPNFPTSTVQGHKGKLVLGHLGGQPIVAMAGRFHYYEGYTAKQITFPVRVMKFLGIELLILSNAAGSANQHIQAGDIVFLKDHINMQPDNPLRGPNDERLGPRFPDMLHTYDRELNAKGLEIAQKHNIRAHEGVYLALQGPNLETPAEYNFFHIIGADLVGMSTVPEVLVAKHMGLKVMAMSAATNKCYPLEEIRETTHEDVIAVAQGVEPKMRKIVMELLQELA